MDSSIYPINNEYYFMLKLIFGHGSFLYPQLNNICNVVLTYYDWWWLLVEQPSWHHWSLLIVKISMWCQIKMQWMITLLAKHPKWIIEIHCLINDKWWSNPLSLINKTIASKDECGLFLCPMNQNQQDKM